MALSPGARLGPYEILSAIGAGGMGEVYRARDTKLGRDVAIKVLRESVATDPERLARFHREAQLLASLNHPNIAHIHGYEESKGVQALVMELVEGPTLADRIAQGPIPVNEALPIAKQIAEALEAAHEQGIVHRDLQPANIKVRDDGMVKVLDFGLAKLVETPATISSANLTASPTITTPAMTQAGIILGTAAYMSPEQAKGRPADKRSDVWAFGCVLYEMLTGRRAFEGEDTSDTLAAVLRAEPAWRAWPADVPRPIEEVVRGCLQKDRTQRVSEISTALFVIDHALVMVEPAPASAIKPSPWRVLVFAAITVVSALFAGTIIWIVRRPVPPPVSLLAIVPSGPAALTLGGVGRDLTLSPDGTRVAYVGPSGTIIIRRLDQLDPLSRDGSRFLLFKAADTGEADGRSQLVVAQNWTLELQRLLATN